MIESIISRYRRLLPEDDFKSVEIYLDDCTPTHLLSMNKWNNLLRIIDVPPGKEEEFSLLEDAVKEILHHRGYRENIYTYQEHQLFGSTVSEYSSRPYVPIGVICGEMTVEEVSYARSLEKIFLASGYYFGGELLVNVSLEPLDKEGNTIRDPVLLDDSLAPVHTVYAENFPCRRG